MKRYVLVFFCLMMSVSLFGCDEKNDTKAVSNEPLGERFDAVQICKDLYLNDNQASFKYSDGSVELTGKLGASYSKPILKNDDKGSVLLSIKKVEKKANLDTFGDLKSIMKKINTINITIYASIKADKSEAKPYIDMEGQTKTLLIDKIDSLKAEQRYVDSSHEVVLDCSFDGKFIKLN